MVLTTVNATPHGLALMLGWRRVLFTLGVSVLLGLLNTVPSSSPTSIVVGRALLVCLVAMLVFGLFEQWPARLPRGMARWALQLLGVGDLDTARRAAGVLVDDGRSPAVRGEPGAAHRLLSRLQQDVAPAPLRWIRATVGQSLRLIAVDEIGFLRSDKKYTLVGWR